MMARQAPVSVAVMRRWEPHDPGRSRLLDVITHYVTVQPNSQNDGALPRLEPSDRALLAAISRGCPGRAGPASWSSETLLGWHHRMVRDCGYSCVTATGDHRWTTCSS